MPEPFTHLPEAAGARHLTSVRDVVSRVMEDRDNPVRNIGIGDLTAEELALEIADENAKAKLTEQERNTSRYAAFCVRWFDKLREAAEAVQKSDYGASSSLRLSRLLAAIREDADANRPA